MAFFFHLRLLLDRFPPTQRLLMLLASVAFLVVVLAVVVFFLGVFEHQSYRDKRESLRAQVDETESIIEQSRRDLSDPRFGGLDINGNNSELLQRLNDVNERVDQVAKLLISPDRIASILQEILLANNLSLLNFEVTPATLLQNNQTPDVPIYKHSLALEFEGNYSALLNYLAIIENKPWRLFWDQIIIKEAGYPKLRIQLIVHTLSDREVWLNV